MIIPEEWREIEGTNGAYKVSSRGRVLSVARMEEMTGRHPKPYLRVRNEKLLKGRAGNMGYCQVGLYQNGAAKRPLVHRLVAQAFIPNPDNKPEVNHKNGIKTDNRVENLEWVTREENALHSTQVLEKNRGEDNAFCKLSVNQVIEIVALTHQGYNLKELADMYNVTSSAIYRIIRGDNWSWLTGIGKEKQL